MAIPKHKSIKFLQAQAPRLRDINNEIVNILGSTVLQYKTDVSTPSQVIPSHSPIRLTATSSRDGGTFSWEIVGGPITGVSLQAPTGSRSESIDLTYTTAVTVETVTVKATHTTPVGMYPTPTAERQLILTKQGPAQSTRTLTLYKGATGTPAQPVPPTAPAGALTYRFSDNTFPINTTGWAASAPSSPSLPVYFIQRNVSTYDVNSTQEIDVLAGWSAPAGITQQGVSPALLSLKTTGYAFLFSDSTQTTSTSPSISLTAEVVNTSGTVTWTATAYNSSNVSLGDITSINGTTGITKTLTSQQFTLGGNLDVKYVKITAAVDQIQDTVTIYRGDNGADSLILWLQNESHNIPAQTDGSTYDLGGATTNIRVFKGFEDVTQYCTFTATVLTGTISPASVGGTAASPTYTVSSLGTDTATVAVRTTYNGVLLEKVFTITKSKQGASSGVVVLNQSGGVFVQAKSGQVQPAQISLTTTVSNIVAPVYAWYKDEILIQGAVQSQYQVPAAQVLTQATYTVRVTGIINGVTNQIREDSTTLARVIDGQDALSVILSNESHTFPADVNGNVTSYAGSGTTIKVYKGSTELNYDGVGTTNQSWALQTSYTNIYPGSVVDSGTFATLGPAQGVQPGTDTSSIIFTIYGKGPDGVSFSVTKQQQFSKSRAGETGPAGSSATVNMANLKQAIESNSSTTINIASSSTLFKTSSGQGGVFIGGGGIYGKNQAGTVTTFAIDGQTGAASFRGAIEGDSTLSITGAAQTSLQLYGLAGTKSTYTTCAAINTVDTQRNMGIAGLNKTTGAVGIGVYGEASGSNSNAAGVAGFGFYGVYAVSISSTGAGLLARGNSSTGTAIQADTGYAIFTCTNYTLNPAGNMTITGSFTASGNVTAYSDKLIKNKIRPISQAASKLKKINGYQYKNLLANKYDCGIIAQEIEKILPELVEVGTTEYNGTKLKTVNYNGVVALLVAANRELIARIEALEKQVHASTLVRTNKSR